MVQGEAQAGLREFQSQRRQADDAARHPRYASKCASSGRCGRGQLESQIRLLVHQGDAPKLLEWLLINFVFWLQIPAERSCADAYIEPHWCACLQWENIPVSDPIVERLAHKFVTTLNEYTTEHQDVCDRLAVSEIMWVTKLKPNEKLLKFNKNADLDGFVGEFSAKMDIKYNMYQIKVMLTPGKSIFEASFTHFLADDRLELKLSDVSRINMYGRQARCIENEFPNLRKYCYCKDELP